MIPLWQELKVAARTLARRPAFAAVCVVVMALGIGANTAIFSMIHAVLLAKLPYADVDRIVQLWHTPPQRSFPGRKRFSLSAANFLDWQRQNHSFERMALYTFQRYNLTGSGKPETVLASGVTRDFFPLLGISPLYGRTFLPEEDQPGRNHALVLSDRFWKTHFAASPSVVGKTVFLDGLPYTVVGVMGPKMTKPEEAEFWLPLGLTAQEAAVRNEHHYLALGKLRPGISVKEGQEDLSTISKRLEQAYPQDDKGWGSAVVPLQEETVGEVRPALLMMMAAVTFVLLIACANVANLVLARTLDRRKEIAIRSAVGAGPWDIRRQLIFESTMLAVGGGVAGLLLAHFCVQLLVHFFAVHLPRVTEVGLDPVVLLFTLVLSVATGIISGLIPSWIMSKASVADALKRGLGNTDADAGNTGVRSTLIMIEVSLSFVLLIGAGLMVRTLWALRAVRPGFDVQHAVAADVMASPRDFKSATQESQFFQQVQERLRSLPGVEAVGGISDLPLTGGSNQPVAVEGKPVLPLSEQPEVSVRVITPGYTAAMRVPLLQGRNITESDTAESAGVVVISESMAKQFWPEGGAVGHHLTLSFSPGKDWQVIGVVGDVKQNGIDTDVGVATLYQPLAQTVASSDSPWRPTAISVVVRSSAASETVGLWIASAVHDLNRDIPVRNVRTLQQLVAETLAEPAFNMQLLVVFSVLALLLSVLGIYSVLSYSVRRRMRDIALRITLGARSSDVLRMVLLQGLKPTVAGIAVGLITTLLLSRFLSSLVYGVQTTDAPTLISVTITMTAVALLASLIPARRAKGADPLTILRED